MILFSAAEACLEAYCITHGKPTFAAWNDCKGPRIFGAHWTVHVGLLYMVAVLVGLGVVPGGCAQVATYALPVMGIWGWAFLIVVAYQAWVYRYRQTDARLVPSRLYDFSFWLSLIVIGYMGVRSMGQLVEQLRSW